MFDALRDGERLPDPVFAALGAYNLATAAFNACDARTSRDECDKLGDLHIEALHRVERTAPISMHGLAYSLEAFYADAVECDLAVGQLEWLKRLVACARALS